MIYLVKKIGIFLLSLFLVITLTFFLMKAIPGDPFVGEKAIPKEILTSLHAYYGLDKPLLVQYLSCLKGFITGNFPPSILYEGKHLEDFIKEGFPISALLGLEALIIAISVGLFLGSIAAFYQNRWQDHLAEIFTLLGISIPGFLLATLFQYLFAFKLSLVPIARWGELSHTFLPALSIAALPTAFIARLTRFSMLSTLRQGYIKTAYAKGLSPIKVYFKHVLKNSIVPVLAYLAPLSAHVLTGSFIVEKIFAIPGLGQWFVNSILQRDYPIIMGLTVFYSALLLFCVFLVDLALPLFDPKMEKSRL